MSKNANQRWEDGEDHHPESVELYKKLEKLDMENGDVFGFKSGGDGDNGEHLMYLLDIVFEERDEAFWAEHSGKKKK
jgi:hypothetical protein